MQFLIDDYNNTSGNSTVPDDSYVTLETSVTYDCHSITPGNSTVSDDYYLPGNSTVPDDNFATLETSRAYDCHLFSSREQCSF